MITPTSNKRPVVTPVRGIVAATVGLLSAVGVILGIDISHYQAGTDVKLYNMVIAKSDEGTAYTDMSYNGFARQAASDKTPFAAYHYLHHGNPKGEAAHAVKIVGKRVPISVDCEWSGKCNSADIHAFVAEVRRLGGRVTLLYVPRSYWQSIGSPNFKDIKGVGLWNAAYPGGSSYPGNNSSAWNGYGGLNVVIWQYSDGSGKLDRDAFRGTKAQLCTYLECWTVGPTPKPSPTPTPRPTVPTPPRPPVPPTVHHSKFVTSGPHTVIRLGSRGRAVTVAQEALGITHDGRFGVITQMKVKSFQHAHHLTADGIVGPKTWRALYLYGR